VAAAASLINYIYLDVYINFTEREAINIYIFILVVYMVVKIRVQKDQKFFCLLLQTLSRWK